MAPALSISFAAGASAVLIAGVAGSGLASAQDLADVIERSEKSVVRIEVKGASGDSLGSGFVVDSKGTLVTNVHVLAGAQSARAVLPDNRVFNIVGTVHLDPSRDIAIAVLDGQVGAIPPIRIASTTPRKGESVVALGSPHGLSFTATTGVVSAIRPAAELGKEMGRPSMNGTWIQIDAALSPGNSGGPLINASGEVVAMSTLASQGSAQNLNFGISAADIRTAVNGVHDGSRPVPLSQGAGQIKMKERESRESSGLAVAEVPQEAIKAYAQLARDTFKDLTREMRSETERLKSDLKEMRKGQTFIPRNVSEPDADIVRVKQPGKRTSQWFFRDESIKSKEVSSADARVRELTKLAVEVKDLNDKKSELLLLTKYGPKLDPRRAGSVGFMSEAIVLHAFNAHDALVVYNEAPYLIVLESTAGLSQGQEVMPTAVFVAGTATAATRTGGTSSFTVLQSVSEREISQALYGVASTAGSGSVQAAAPSSDGAGTTAAAGAAAGGDSYRTWYDRSGSFSVEAVLLSADEKEVRLRKRDGKVVTVPRARLSDADLKYLAK